MLPMSLIKTRVCWRQLELMLSVHYVTYWWLSQPQVCSKGSH